MELVLRATVIYFFLWAVARGTGKRELAQMTAFQLRPASVVIPVGFAVQTFLPIVLEPLFLREQLSSMAYDGAPVIAGLVLLLAGTLVVARNDRQDTNQHSLRLAMPLDAELGPRIVEAVRERLAAP